MLRITCESGIVHFAIRAMIHKYSFNTTEKTDVSGVQFHTTARSISQLDCVRGTKAAGIEFFLRG